MDTVVSLETGAPLKAAEFNGKTALIFVCRIRGRRNIWCVWEEATVPVCGRKAMAAEEWLAPLLCCGWSWKLEVWGLGSLLRGSYTTLAWLSWVDSGWQVEWLTRTGVGREAGKKRSRCSFVYLGVVGASLEACWRQKKKKKKRQSSIHEEVWLTLANHPLHRQTSEYCTSSPLETELLRDSEKQSRYFCTFQTHISRASFASFTQQVMNPLQSFDAAPRGFTGWQHLPAGLCVGLWWAQIWATLVDVLLRTTYKHKSCTNNLWQQPPCSHSRCHGNTEEHS